MPTPSSRVFSSPQSVVSSVQSSSVVHVKKVVLDGRSKSEGATIRMYLKLSVAIDNAQPGTSIPLFPEDNVRIITSEVHPLDERSVPYYFSATEQPLLQKTAMALQLGPKSSSSYQSLFSYNHNNTSDPNTPSTSRRHREHSSLDAQHYTGHIIVSGYNVALVLPKEFPPRIRSRVANPDSDGDDGHVKEVPSTWSTRSARRASSIFNKNYLYLMVGIELFLPYVLTPPRGPFLVSIPVPRCLDNHLKIRIAIPQSNAATRNLVDSASSGDDAPGWDFLTDPPVSRKIDKSSRKPPPYSQGVDDDQSDAISTAASTPGTEVIQGAFQSTDFLHIRWAPPLGRKSGALKSPEDGMRRVSVQSTHGKMKCHILGRDQHGGVRMGIVYEGTCTGLWHPGVATILGMDVALDVKGRRVTWPDEDTAGWAVTGEEGFTGLYSEVSGPSRQASFGSNFSSTWLPRLASNPVVAPIRSSASLLRAPLEIENTPEYSFENSPNGLGTPLTPAGDRAPSVSGNEDVRMSRPDAAPGKVVTLKINIMKLLPPAKNELNFRIRGVVVINLEEQEDFFFLPEFRVLGSHPQDTKTWVSCRTGDAAFYLGEQSAQQASKRRLRVGEEVHCEDAVGLFVGPSSNPTVSPSSPTTTAADVTPTLHRTPSRTLARRRRSRSNAKSTSGERDDASQLPMLQQLPCVLNTVTPLLGAGRTAHCVRVNIPMYSLDADTIQFGLAIASSSSAVERSATTVDVLYASYAGRQVYVEVLARDAPMPTQSPTTSEQDNHIIGEMHSLLVVHFEDVEADTGEIEIVYVVTAEDDEAVHKGTKGKGKEKEKDMNMDVLLPCFDLPIARYEVVIERPPNLVPHIDHSTLPHRHITQTNSQKLVHFRLPAGFFATLSLSLLYSADASTPVSKTRKVTSSMSNIVIFITFIATFFLLTTMASEIREIRHTMHAAAQTIMNGIPYSETYWGYDGTMPRVQDPIVSTTVTTVTTTAVHTTTIQMEPDESPATPTINLADATPVPERRISPHKQKVDRERVDQARALIPAIPLLSLRLPISAEAKEFIVKTLMRAWHLIKKAWNFPMDPD